MRAAKLIEEESKINEEEDRGSILENCNLLKIHPEVFQKLFDH